MEATIIASLPYLNIVHLNPQILHISIAHVIYIKQLQYLQPCYIYQCTITAKYYFFNDNEFSFFITLIKKYIGTKKPLQKIEEKLCLDLGRL